MLDMMLQAFNIVKFLITPNEIIVKIISILFTFADSIFVYYITCILLNTKYKKKDFLKFLILFNLSIISINFLVPLDYKLFFTFLSILLLVCKFFNVHIFNAFITTSILLLFQYLIDAFVLTLLKLVNHTNISISTILSLPIIQVLLFYLFILLNCLFLKICFKNNFNINVFKRTSKKTLKLILSNCFIDIFLIIPIILFMYNNFSNSFNFIYLYFFISLIIFVLISLYSIYKSSSLEATVIKLNSALTYNETLNVTIDSLKIYKHDFDNITNCIYGMVKANEIDSLKKYLEKVVNDTHELNDLCSLQSDDINEPAIKALILSKFLLCNKNNIKLDIKILTDLTKINLSIYTFCKILGILLDNSIEASKECETKYISLEILENLQTNKQILKIQNTFKNENIDLGKIFEKEFSTKIGNSGIGLWEVKKIVDQNRNLFLDTHNSNTLFCQTLEMNI